MRSLIGFQICASSAHAWACQTWWVHGKSTACPCYCCRDKFGFNSHRDEASVRKIAPKLLVDKLVFRMHTPNSLGGKLPRQKTREQALTPLELEIMNVLWETGPANVQTVQARMKGRDLAYTTVQTMLNVLHRKGKVKRQLKDRAYRVPSGLQPAEAQSRRRWATCSTAFLAVQPIAWC